MIAVNDLIHDAYESINVVGLGESADGDLDKVGVKQLNRLISTLNAQGFLTMSQKHVDAPRANRIYFRKLEPDEVAEHSIDMVPPVKVEGVARKLGLRFIPLLPSNHEHMAMKNPYTMATAWTYDIEIEDGPTQPRNVGILTLDGDPHNEVRIWYNGQIPKYKLDETIYLPDIYNELLMSGLCVFLAEFHELSQEKKAELNVAFTTAKNLIKVPTAQQRMSTGGIVMGSYNDAYCNGLAGNGF